ncbi:hypothetical protein [Flaviaesturariibacter terrae]
MDRLLQDKTSATPTAAIVYKTGNPQSARHLATHYLSSMTGSHASLRAV